MKPDPEDWRDIGSGFLLGLYEDSAGENKTSCKDCWKLGANLALINTGIIQVEFMRDKWLNKDLFKDILNPKAVLRQINFLQICYAFIAFLVPIDNIL